MELETTSNTPPNGNAPNAASENAPAPNNNSPGPILSGSSGNTPANTIVGSHNIHITERVFCVESWPNGLVLEARKFNWHEWCRHTTLLARKQGFAPWLDGSLKCPDKQQYPQEHFAWQNNDTALSGFLQEFISPADFALVENLPTSHEVFETLRLHHEQPGPVDQAFLLRKFLNVRFDRMTPVSETADELEGYIKAMGKIDNDNWKTLALLNALWDNPRRNHLLTPIQIMSTQPGFCSESVVKLILDEGRYFAHLRTEQGLPSRPSALSRAATSSDFPVAILANMRRLRCSNCKRPNHSIDYCIALGGKMAGRSIDDARTAQRAASGKCTRTPRAIGISPPQRAHVASQLVPTPRGQTTIPLINLNGFWYAPIPS